ncbi:serine/threonine protein kinase [Kribbella amoyensis]|uniref:Serine/threonine protein kinase n=1 Tax=Kribbella amoyensis TaxID=996641 RepID=A0A561BWG4_9ACTN|nr:protein kinase [Kribbella amoyensis]TWD83236.1 serine/threonine protein kinase [Kribbella amoyensis]
MALEDIAGYSLRRRLGAGSVGTVWLLRDLASGRHAVLKRIPTTAIHDPEEFHRDLTLIRSIDHAHIARLIEVRQTETDWLLFSQYVPAGTLGALLKRRGDLTRGELVTLMGPLAQALSTLHQLDLHHGALSLTNIMLDADGRPVITDAGLRTLQTTGTQPAATQPTATQPTGTAAEDLAVLATLARRAGADIDLLPDGLFAADARTLAQTVFRLAEPVALNLGFEAETTSLATDSTSPPTDTKEVQPKPINLTARRLPPRRKPTTPSSQALARRPFLVVPSTDHHRPETPTRTPPNPNAPNPAPTNPAPTNAAPTSPIPRLAAPTPSARPADVSPPTSASLATPNGPLPTPDLSSPSPGSATSSNRPAQTRRSRPAKARRSHSRGRSQLRRTSRPSRKPRRTTSQRLDRILTTARQAAGRKQAAYGILAAAALAAVIVLVLGLITLDVLGTPTTNPAAASTPTADPTRTTPTPTTPALTPAPTTSTTPPPSTTTAVNPSAPHATSNQPSAWLQILKSLDQQRSRAFASLDPTALSAVYHPGSPPWTADRALLATYKAQQVRIDNLQIQIQHLTIEKADPTTTVLRVTDRLYSGTATDKAGHRTTFEPGTPTPRRITLTATNNTWRIAAITKA